MENGIFSIIQLFIDDANELSGVDAISLVNSPAIQEDFYAFNKQYMTNFTSIDDEKRMVTGPALIPNKMILREVKGKYFYVYMSEETIRKTAYKFVKTSKGNNSTLEHELKLKEISVIESWIKEDMVHDKSVKYGYDLPLGTWFLTTKIDNDEIWAAIKSGDIKGYSIEGRYTDKIIKNSEVTIEDIAELELLGTEEEKETYREIVKLLEMIEQSEEIEEEVEFTDEIGVDMLATLQGEDMSNYNLIDSREVSDDNIPVPEWAESKLNLAVVKSKPNEDSSLDKNEFKVRYVYTEKHSSSNSRTFCKEMMSRTNSGVVYRYQDIIQASFSGVNKSHGHNGKNYNLFKWAGGVNCKHFWSEQLYELKRKGDGTFVDDKSLSSSDEISNASTWYTPKPKGLKESKESNWDRADKGHHPDYKS